MELGGGEAGEWGRDLGGGKRAQGEPGGREAWGGARFHQKNLSAGRTILPYPAAACMIIVDLCFFTNQTIFWRAVTQRQINVKSNVI